MGWLVDYLEKLSLIDYANRQRHRMEHPELYVEKRRRDEKPSPIEETLRRTEDMHHENMMKSIEDRNQKIAEILRKAEDAKKAEKNRRTRRKGRIDCV